MDVKARLGNYDKIQFSITLTAPVEDWRAMLRQLESLKSTAGYYAWPAGGFIECVQKMLADLDKTHAAVLIREDCQ